MPPTPPHDDHDLGALLARMDAMQQRIDELESTLARRTDPPTATGDRVTPVSRRALLGLAGAGIAGVAIGTSASPAAAADNDPVILGEVNNVAQTTTRIVQSDATSTAFQVELTGVNGSAGSRGAIAGVSAADLAVSGEVLQEGGGTGVRGQAIGADSYGVNGRSDWVGVYGEAVFGEEPGALGYGVLGTTASGVGVVGQADQGIGGRFESASSAQLLLVRSDDVDPVVGPPSGENPVGSISLDDNGDLWLCTATGEPGTWTRLNEQGPTFFTTAQRAYDSRPAQSPPGGGTKGRFGAGETRTIDLTTETDLPAGATAVLANITVTGTDGASFVSFYRADVPTVTPPTFSTINWFATGQTLGTSTTTPVGGGGVKVYANRATHVIIDVIGYYA